MKKIESEKKLKPSRKFPARTSANIKILQTSFVNRDAQGKHAVRDNMPCLCQYFSTEPGLRAEQSLNVKDNLVGDVSTGDVTASELAACKAEIFSLKRNLTTARISSANMENLMKVMIEKQNFLIAEVYELRKLNDDFRLQQVTDRNSQALERSALLKELHEVKMLLRDRTGVLERTLQRNFDLTTALRDANEKIYEMGIKFLKLKGNRSPSRNAAIDATSTATQSSDEGTRIEGDFSQTQGS